MYLTYFKLYHICFIIICKPAMYKQIETTDKYDDYSNRYILCLRCVSKPKPWTQGTTHSHIGRRSGRARDAAVP